MSTNSRSASPVRHPLVVKDTNSNSNNNSNCNTPTKLLSLSGSTSTSKSNSPSKKRSTYSHHDENSPSFKKNSPNKNSNLQTRPLSPLKSSSSIHTSNSIKNINNTGLTPLKSASRSGNNKINVFSPSSTTTNSLSSLSLSPPKTESINPPSQQSSSLSSSSSSSKRINNKLLQFQIYEDPKPYIKNTQLTSDIEKDEKFIGNQDNDENKSPMINQDVKKDLQYKIRNREMYPGVLKDLNIRKFPGFISNDIASDNGILSNKFQLINTWIYEFDNNKRHQNSNISNNSQNSIENVLASSSSSSSKTDKKFNIPSYITPPKGNRVKYIDTLSHSDNCVKDLSNNGAVTTAPHDTVAHGNNYSYTNNRRKSIGETIQKNKDSKPAALNFMIFNDNIDK
ncbi:unnamed protein product [[Candida] boidinii]|nr:unnamed protein product [[Candida] boidinii]